MSSWPTSVMSVHLIVLLQILSCFETIHGTTNIPLSTQPALTVEPLVVGYLETATDNKLNLTNRYCEWNVSMIVQLINETAPTFLYTDTNKALLTEYLPTYITRRLPPSLLLFYGLNYTEPLPEDCTPGGTDNRSLSAIDFCVWPLVHTDKSPPDSENREMLQISLKNVTGLDMFLNVSFDGCALACSAAWMVYGIGDEQQSLMDSTRTVICMLCYVLIIILVTNLYLDQKRKNEKLRDRSLLQTVC